MNDAPRPPRFIFEEFEMIGANDLWTFAVGRIGNRWLGCALGILTDPPGKFLNIMPEVSEGYELGLPDKAAAIRLTSALALDPAHAFGPPPVWRVPAHLVGKPDDFRCPYCGEVGCDQIECRDAQNDHHFEGDGLTPTGTHPTYTPPAAHPGIDPDDEEDDEDLDEDEDDEEDFDDDEDLDEEDRERFPEVYDLAPEPDEPHLR